MRSAPARAHAAWGATPTLRSEFPPNCTAICAIIQLWINFVNHESAKLAPMNDLVGDQSMSVRIRHLRAILASINEQLQQDNLRPEARDYLRQTADSCRATIRELALKL